MVHVGLNVYIVMFLLILWTVLLTGHLCMHVTTAHCTQLMLFLMFEGGVNLAWVSHTAGASANFVSPILLKCQYQEECS